jgi:hypothetical protein
MKIRDNINISNQTKCNNNILDRIVHFINITIMMISNYLNDIKKNRLQL